MTTEVRPLGVACDLQCTYCYQNPMRAASAPARYDLDAMKAGIERAGGPFVVFGGEPLLLPLGDLEELWRWGYERWKKNYVQTNARALKDEHLRLFRDYNVQVGVSMDGPGELNDPRRAGSLDRTRATSARIERNILRIAKEWKPPGLIVTLHRSNASSDVLPRLAGWLRSLHAEGIRSVRLHLLEADDEAARSRLALDARQNMEAVRYLVGLEEELEDLRFDISKEIEQLLLGRDKAVSCVWSACDPYSTPAVRGIEGDGQASNCGRTNKEGVDFAKSDDVDFQRYLTLARTPQELGGCQGCRFFLLCKGQCPGTAIDGDWRNRTEHCEVYKDLFTHFEARLLERGETPLTRRPDLPELERRMLAIWERGRSERIQTLVEAAPVPGAASQAGPEPGLASFVRTGWVSDRARAVWEPRLEAVRQAGPALVVAHAERSGRTVLVRVARERIHDLKVAAAAAGLSAAPCSAGVPASSCWFVGPTVWSAGPRRRAAQGNRTRRTIRAETWVVGPRDDVRRIRGAAAPEQEVDGYPHCCLAASRDEATSAWDLASRTLASVQHHLVVEQPAHRPLRELLGLPGPPGPPCRHGCAPHARLVAGWHDSLGACGDPGKWLRDVESWACRWSALHGIVEVLTPVLRIATNGSPAGRRLVVDLHGETAVEGGVRGTTFPFLAARRRLPLASISRTFPRAPQIRS